MYLAVECPGIHDVFQRLIGVYWVAHQPKIRVGIELSADARISLQFV